MNWAGSRPRSIEHSTGCNAPLMKCDDSRRMPLTSFEHRSRLSAPRLKWRSVNVNRQAMVVCEPLQRATDVVHAETLRLSILVDQLLTLSRQEMSLQGGQHESVSLRELLLDVVEMLRIVAEEKGLHFVLNDISDQTVLGDEMSLNQLFFNLIDNAVKYTPADGTMTIACQHDGSIARVTIEDTGIGIEQKHHEHLFERFYRVEAARSTAGTGLGLAICRSIVDAHHGKINVESEPGRGTKFTVVLPAPVQVSRTMLNRQILAKTALTNSWPHLVEFNEQGAF